MTNSSDAYILIIIVSDVEDGGLMIPLDEATGVGMFDAAGLVDALDRLQSRIPEFTQLTKEKSLALRKAATLDPKWLYMIITGIGASPAVESILGSTGEELMEEMADIRRWDQAESAARMLASGIAAANVVRRHRLGLKALQAYAICRQLIRQREHSDLIPFVQEMTQMNKLGKRKPKPAAADAPQETPTS